MSQAGPTSDISGAGAVLFLAGNTGGEVGPSGLGILNVVGAGTISVTGNAGTNTLTISDMDSAWQSVSASQSMISNMGYFVVSPGGAVVLTLPATSVQGDIISVALDGATSFKIAQGAGQSMQFGSASPTTVGVTGSFASTNRYDTVNLIAAVGGSSTVWLVQNSIGNITIV